MSMNTTSARTLPALCLASFAWAFSFGLGAPLASLWLKDAEHDDAIIGLNTGTYYLGIALAACLVPWMMRRWGRGCAVVGMILSGITTAIFPLGAGLAGWFVLRLLNGVGGAMSLIPLETHVNHNAPPERRSRDFGFYAFAVALGIALGTWVGLQMYEDWAEPAFIVGGALSFAAAGVVILAIPRLAVVPVEEADRRVALPLAPGFLSLGVAWSQGFLEGALVAFLPIYLLAIRLTSNAVSWLMSGVMIGVIVCQVPIAWLADRLGRTAVLLGCCGVTVLALGWLPFCHETEMLAVTLFLAGACSGAFYPLGLAILGERLPGSALPRANAWYLAINCIGSLTGPVACGFAMKLFGQRAMFATGIAAVVAVVAGWLVVRGYTRRHDDSEDVENEQRTAA